MSTFTRAGNFLHDKLLNGAGSSMMSHIGSGVGVGGIFGAGSAMVNGNDSLLGGAVSGGMQGAMLGVGSKFASAQYAKGVANHIMNTVDPKTGQVFAGVKESMVRDVGNFKFGHFVASNNNNVHANYWHPDANIFKQVDFKAYNPRYTTAPNAKENTNGSSFWSDMIDSAKSLAKDTNNS